MENDMRHRAILACTAVCRFVLAVVFIFSGFVKAVDPLGTQYKIQDYMVAFGWDGYFPDMLALGGSMLLAILEFCLGVYLFFGIRRIIAPRAVVTFMAIMTPLTFWIALFNPVADCGCFGDALVLDNWETFAKNVVLLAMSVVVLKWRKLLSPLVSIRFDWVIALYGFLYIFCVTMYSYWELPVFDFRPYYVGADIAKGMEVPEGKQPTTYETIFLLEKDGQKMEFTEANYPDSTWTFVDSWLAVKEKGYEPPIKEFMMERWDDGEDITRQVLQYPGYTFLLISHRLDIAYGGELDLIYELYDYCQANGYPFYCLTTASDREIDEWRMETGMDCSFCIMEDVTLKTMIRSNPGLILLKDGVVVRKWGKHSFPDEYQLNGLLEELPIGKPDSTSLMMKALRMVAWFFLPLIVICALDMAWERRRRNREKSEQKRIIINPLNKE